MLFYCMLAMVPAAGLAWAWWSHSSTIGLLFRICVLIAQLILRRTTAPLHAFLGRLLPCCGYKPTRASSSTAQPDDATAKVQHKKTMRKPINPAAFGIGVPVSPLDGNK